jgi:hypothetical protein
MRIIWSRGLPLAAFLIIAVGCGSSDAVRAGDSIDVDGDGKPDGQALDLNGDGRVDAVDVDGDGKPDGEDVDGDGVITIWADLRTGEVLPSPQDMREASVGIDPDLYYYLDPEHPPHGLGADGVIGVPDAVLFEEPDFPVAMQGKLGSCAAFANMATAAILNSRFHPAPSNDLPSAAFLYARQLQAGRGTCSEGSMIEAGLDTLVREGAPTETDLPYDDSTCAVNPPNPDGAEFRIGSWAYLQPFDRARVKKALAADLVLPFGTTLPSNFGTFKGPQALSPFRSAPTPDGGPHGSGHAMVIVGYDDRRHAYRVLNSWGTDWGDRGYIWWDYDDLESRERFIVLVPLPLPAPMDLGPPSASVQIDVVGAVASPEADIIAVRLKTSEPVHIDKLAFYGYTVALDQWFAYGDVTFPSANRPPGTYVLTLSGTSRSGAAVSGALALTVEESGEAFARRTR